MLIKIFLEKKILEEQNHVFKLLRFGGSFTAPKQCSKDPGLLPRIDNGTCSRTLENAIPLGSNMLQTGLEQIAQW